MTSLRTTPALLVLITNLVIAPVWADPDAVDLADTLDFERFHEADVWAIGIGQGGALASKTPDVKDPDEQTDSADQDVPQTVVNERLASNDSARHRISNPYTFKKGRSNQTASDATETLFRNMAETCPQGWQKDREWTTPTAEGFLLHYEFHCLDNPS